MKLLPIKNLFEVTADLREAQEWPECSDGIFKILSRNHILLIVAQYCYVRFSNNEREHFRLQINSWLGAISFDKAFTMNYTIWIYTIQCDSSIFEKVFHMVSGTTSGLVGTKYISNWSLELYNLCLPWYQEFEFDFF
jgi:hypothetical protein